MSGEWWASRTVAIVDGLVLTAILTLGAWFFQQRLWEQVSAATIMVLVLTLLLLLRLGLDVWRWRRRRSNRLRPEIPQRKLAELARRMKEVIEDDYQALVMEALPKAAVGVWNSRFAEAAGVSSRLLMYAGGLSRDWQHKWVETATFPKFREIVRGVPDELTASTFREIVRRYVASMNEYRALRQFVERRVSEEQAIYGRVRGADALMQVSQAWIQLVGKLEDFEQRVAQLNRHLKAQAPEIPEIAAG